MGKGAGGSDSRSSAWAHPVVAAICILLLLVAAGIAGDGLMSASQAKTLKRPVAPSDAPLAPAAATGAFGLDLMRTLPPGNAVLSPDSVAAALAMTATGERRHHGNGNRPHTPPERAG